MNYEERRPMNRTIIYIILIIVWLYLLSVLKRGKLGFFYFIFGAVGLFLLIITNVELIMQPYIQGTTYVIGTIGKLLNIFDAFPSSGIFFVTHPRGSMSLYLDLECSGIIELSVFTSLILFFPLFSKTGRFLNALKGCLFIYLFNVARILLILVTLKYCGMNLYPLAHSFVGRIVFYVLTIILYFNIFTRSQIKKQKVGKFNYDN